LVRVLLKKKIKIILNKAQAEKRHKLKKGTSYNFSRHKLISRNPKDTGSRFLDLETRLMICFPS